MLNAAIHSLVSVIVSGDSLGQHASFMQEADANNANLELLLAKLEFFQVCEIWDEACAQIITLENLPNLSPTHRVIVCHQKYKLLMQAGRSELDITATRLELVEAIRFARECPHGAWAGKVN